jgi:transposase, IS30 family
VVDVARPRLPKEIERRFWRLIVEGWSTERAACEVSVAVNTGRRWFAEGGGMAPMTLAEPSGRFLSLAERETIDLCWAEGWTKAEIARHLGRHPTTIGRELDRNRLLAYPQLPPLPGGAQRRRGPEPGSQGPGRRPRSRYRAAAAQAKAEVRGRRPKAAKLTLHPRLLAWVQDKLENLQWSPEQISRRLREEFPDDESMRISHEAIYQSLYVQGRGELRRELTACLRTGRALRKPRRRVDERRERIKDKILISERPAEAADRAVPGHWEGDLIVGKDSGSAIGTLVERSTRFVMLLHLPTDHGAETVRDAILAQISTLPAALRRSLTWDQGIELARHTEITIAGDLPVYFCDPHSPWQRGTNENTNGLLRQYFPKGTDLGVHDADYLADIADRLNGRPRKTLGFKTPAEALARILSEAQLSGVATTP